MGSFKNYYHVLRVRSTADEARIKTAFRRLARRHHPDIAKDKRAARRFREIREAYDVLSDPEKRRQYDDAYRTREAALRRLRPQLERSRARSAGLGITLDVLGLSVGLAVDAELLRPGAKQQKGAPRILSRRPKRSEQ